MKMTKNSDLKALIKFLANKYDLTQGQVEEVIITPFLFASRVIKGADPKTLEFPSVRIPFFGLFFVPKRKIEMVKKFREKRDKMEKDGTKPIDREDTQDV